MLDICFEVQVEAEVKLEALVKFCFLHENDIEIPTGGGCQLLSGQSNVTSSHVTTCDCQAFVDTDPIIGHVDGVKKIAD